MEVISVWSVIATKRGSWSCMVIYGHIYSASFYQFVPQTYLGNQPRPPCGRFFKASLIHDKLPGHFATRIKHLGKKYLAYGGIVVSMYDKWPIV